MSINQINSNQFSSLTYPPTSTSTNSGAVSETFSQAIATAAHKLNSQVDPDPAAVAMATAELLKIQMMKSAISLGDETLGLVPSSIGFPVKVTASDFISKRQNADSKSNIPATQIRTNPVEITPSQSNDTVHEIISRASQKYGVDEALIKAVIKVESNFKQSAVSQAGAQGLMQLMPATAKGLGVSDSFNPEQNIMAGTRFLKDMINRYHGNLDSALAAYNWGPGNVDKKGTVSLPQETRAYLAKVKTYYNQYIG
ncbi:lytic transglycosylase domain-containing protein [Geobacter sp. OR-1]|uniref:lytic transglycosylase domain-containing protein n=1 Tax=Geobacter sp. OR-1 TaxID=1266765 RepID=UPI0005A8056F|nr:lytic transglycosylase domain-containing protein [Geobacter sp. OR-1]